MKKTITTTGKNFLKEVEEINLNIDPDMKVKIIFEEVDKPKKEDKNKWVKVFKKISQNMDKEIELVPS